MVLGEGALFAEDAHRAAAFFADALAAATRSEALRLEREAREAHARALARVYASYTRHRGAIKGVELRMLRTSVAEALATYTGLHACNDVILLCYTIARKGFPVSK